MYCIVVLAVQQNSLQLHSLHGALGNKDQERDRISPHRSGGRDGAQIGIKWTCALRGALWGLWAFPFFSHRAAVDGCSLSLNQQIESTRNMHVP